MIELAPVADATIPTEIERMINAAVDRFSNAVDEKLTAFEQRIEEKFVSYKEFEELRNRFNAYPPRPANVSDLEDVNRELDKIRAENNLLKAQVDKAIGGQTEIRESVRNMRETAESVERQGAKMESTANLLIGVVDSYKTVAQGIHAEQELARQERAEWRQKTETLTSEIRRVEDRTDDTEKRFIEAYTPLHGFVMGDKTQPGLPKVLDGLQSEIKAFREEYKKNREFDLEALNFSLNMKRFLIGTIKSVFKPAVLIRILIAIFGGGGILAILIQLINGGH